VGAFLAGSFSLLGAVSLEEHLKTVRKRLRYIAIIDRVYCERMLNIGSRLSPTKAKSDIMRPDYPLKTLGRIGRIDRV
jgi:hypothetical protein